MNIKALSFAISSAIVMICAGTSDAVGSPPGHAGPPGGGGPPGLSDPPGNSDFGHSRGSLFIPLAVTTFDCSYNETAVIANWKEIDDVCGPKYDGDLEIDVTFALNCSDDGDNPAGTARVEFDLDTDPAAVWNFECDGTTCDAEGTWININAAIDLEMQELFIDACYPGDVESGTWAHSEDVNTAWYNGIFAHVKGLCPGQFGGGGRQNHTKVGTACGSDW